MGRADHILEPGTTLYEASAGTGKTYTLTSVYLEWVMRSDLPVSSILAVTYTEAAANELIERIRGRLREVMKEMPSPTTDEERRVRRRVARALESFDDAAIFTIHGFCKRILEENAFESGVPFDAKLMRDQSDLLTEIVEDFYALRVYDADKVVARYFATKGVWPKQLLGLVGTAFQAAETRVEPDPPDVDGILESFEAVFAKTRECWLGNRDSIVGLLMEDPGLKRNIYRVASIPVRAAAMDRYLADSDQACPFIPDKTAPVDYFTTTKVGLGTKKNFEPPHHPFFDNCEDLVRVSRSFDGLLIGFKRDLIDYCKSELARRKRARHLWSFDDLLTQADEAIRGGAATKLTETLRGKYRAVLVDEFQDTDRLQYRIFKRLFKGTCPLVFIGDPKQAIYRFRGADVNTYLEAAGDAEATKRLDTNWRSAPSLVGAVNGLFSSAKDPFLTERISYDPVVARPNAADTLKSLSGEVLPPFQIRLVTSTEVNRKKSRISSKWAKDSLPVQVARDIGNLLCSGATIGDREIGLGDIAVLTHTNREAAEIKDALTQEGISAVVFGSSSVFDSIEAEELEAVLAALHRPRNRGIVKAALVTRLLGLTAADIDDLDKDEAAGKTASNAAWQRIEVTFATGHLKWFDKGFAAAIASILSFEPNPGRGTVLMRMAEGTEGARRVSNFRHLVELLTTAATEQRLGPAALKRWFAFQLNQTGEDQDTSLRLETDGEAVKVVTIHKSKGLEYNVCYLPFLFKPRAGNRDKSIALYHDADNDSIRTLDLGSSDMAHHQKQAELEQTQEDQRLLYVALTRAKHLCMVAWGGIEGFEKSAMGYLLHQGDTASSREAILERIKGLTEEEIRLDLDRFKSAAGKNAVSISPLDPKPNAQKAPEPEAELRARTLRAPISRGRDYYSFSSLSGGSGEDAPHHLATSETADGDRIVLDAFDKGTRAGLFFHAALEHLEFDGTDRAVTKKTVEDTLRRYRYDPDIESEVVMTAIGEILACRFSEADKTLRLGKLPRENRIDELEFFFPIIGRTNQNSTTSTAMAKILDGRPDGVGKAYAKRLFRLGFDLNDGFVKGFVDLVFEWAGRYYLVDYKTNYLGDHYSDYAPKNLEAAMVAHDYVLQYHLYTVALHRYLSGRIPAYDYDRHFGGVFYLFLRGMSQTTGPATGVFHDHPDKETVDQISNLFGETGSLGVR